MVNNNFFGIGNIKFMDTPLKLGRKQLSFCETAQFAPIEKLISN